MNTVQRIAKNTALIVAASVATTVINFFYFMYTARYLGAEGFGVLSLALALTSMFSVLTDIGLSVLMTREVARDRSLARKYLGNLAVMKVFLAVVVFGLIALTANILGYPQQTITAIYLIALSVVCNAFSTMLYAIFQAYEKMEFITIGQVLTSVLLLGGALFAIRQGLGVTAFAAVYFLSSAIALACNSAISVWKFPGPKLEIDFTFWKGILRHAWPFGLVGVFTYLYYSVDSVMLSKMQGVEAVGWYNAGYRLFWALSFISSAYYISVFPVMSRLYVSSEGSLRFIYEKSIKLMTIIAVPIGVGVTLLAGRIIQTVFGAEYARSAVVLQILIWAVVFTFVSAGFAHLFNSLNRQIIVTKVTGVCAALNIILNLALIPLFSYVGAGIARAATDFIALALVFVWSRGIGYGISGRKYVSTVVRVLVAGGVMAVSILLLPDLTLWWLVPLAAVVYFAVLFLIRGIDGEDMALFRRVLNRRGAALRDRIDDKNQRSDVNA